jgi:hypothetical protein
VKFAISWAYLLNYSGTGLAPGQSWNVTTATISAQNDHANPDPGGDTIGVTFSDPITTGGFVLQDINTVPEPANVALGLFGSLSLVVVAARRRQQMQERLRQWRAAFAQWLDVA